LQDVNTHASVQDITELFLVNQFTCITLAVRGGYGAISSGDGKYSSEKMAQKKKHCSSASYINMYKYIQLGATVSWFLFQELYMFRAFTMPIIRNLGCLNQPP
jgi:hypothetical protein